jgi:2-hydroxychromene-2-carboxylate isomerase
MNDLITALQNANENLSFWKAEWKEAFVTEVDCYDDECRAHVVENLELAKAQRKAAQAAVRGY